MNTSTRSNHPTFLSVVAYVAILVVILHLPANLTRDAWNVTQASWSLLAEVIQVIGRLLLSPFGL